MAKENKVIDAMRQTVEKAENGTLFFNNSFMEYDDEYVGHILSGMVSDGTLRRLCRGVYLKTVETRFGVVYPSLDKMAEAIAERDNAQVLPTGATAMNLLGLSTQMPMNPTFLTSGSARVIKLGGRTITFKRAVPKNFAVKGKKRRLIVQAMKAIGDGNMTESDRQVILNVIEKNPEEDTLRHDISVMPTWIRRFYIKNVMKE